MNEAGSAHNGYYAARFFTGTHLAEALSASILFVPESLHASRTRALRLRVVVQLIGFTIKMLGGVQLGKRSQPLVLLGLILA